METVGEYALMITLPANNFSFMVFYFEFVYVFPASWKAREKHLSIYTPNTNCSFIIFIIFPSITTFSCNNNLNHPKHQLQFHNLYNPYNLFSCKYHNLQLHIIFSYVATTSSQSQTFPSTQSYLLL